MERFIACEVKSLLGISSKKFGNGKIILETCDSGLKVWNEKFLGYDIIEYKYLEKVEYYRGFHILLKNIEIVKKLGLDIEFDGFNYVLVLIPSGKMNYNGEYIAEQITKVIREYTDKRTF